MRRSFTTVMILVLLLSGIVPAIRMASPQTTSAHAPSPPTLPAPTPTPTPTPNRHVEGMDCPEREVCTFTPTSPASLKDRITEVTVALPQPLEEKAGNWCTWGGCSISPRLYHEPLADDRTLVGWTDSAGNGHVSVISDTIEHTFDFSAQSIRGLVAHDDGTFAVLLWDPNAEIIWLSKRGENGDEIWTTNLNSEIAVADFWLGDGRLTYGNGLYIVYFTVQGVSGGFTGHHGDQLTFVGDDGVIQDGGWGWGCSHSMAELVSYRADLDQFIAVCSSDCFPGKGIFVNGGHQVYESDGNCGGCVSAQLGQFALGEGSWKLVFNALDRQGYEGHGIALATIDEDYQSDFTWLTNTDGSYERDPVIARLRPDGETERYLVGWTTTNDETYWLGVIDGAGHFLAGPEEVTSAGVAWGNRDDSFRTRADGSISWVQGEPTSTGLHIFRFEESTFTPSAVVYLPLVLRDFSPAPPPTPTPTPEWHVECVDCPRYFADMTDRTLALDTDGQPHVVYGGNHLYYAWRDGTRWYTETVDSAESVGRYASLALDSDDHPHIGYYDAVNKNLKYATWDGSSWTVQTVDDRRDVGLGVSLALDSAGHPHLVYYDRTNQDFHYTRWKYVHWDGSTWIIEPVDGTASWHDWGQASLTLDSQDRPHISYGQGADASLKYATKVGGAWTVQTVDTGIGSGVVSSVAVDSDDQPHISYEVESVSPHEIRYARWNGTSWYTQTVAQINAWGGGYPSLVLDSAGQPHISFHDWGDSQVKYARWDGSAWIIENVGNAGWWAGRNSLMLDAGDRPHIAYHSWSPFQIRYAVKDTSWTLETVDTGGSVGEWSSIDVDDSGHLHVGYQDGLNMRLKYAFYDGTAWASQTVDEAWYGGEHASLALDSAGYPHISYRGDSQLRYARWDGSDWNIETIDASGSAGGYTSLALDAGDHPHISHHDWGDHTLRYATWDGQSWMTQTVDSIGDGGGCSHTSIVMDSDDHPAIAYYDADSQDLKVARWDGANWALQTVDSEENVGCSPALAFDSAGKPHVVYYDSSKGKIKYASWDGANWYTQTVASQGSWSPRSALALGGDDRPHIAYTYGYSERDPMYAYWDGAEWVVETIESDNNAGSWISLALDPSGCPHVSYKDDTNGALKHAWRR